MEQSINSAKKSMLEWWFIFSNTGNIEDARMLIDSIREYDILLSAEEEREF